MFNRQLPLWAALITIGCNTARLFGQQAASPATQPLCAPAAQGAFSRPFSNEALLLDDDDDDKKPSSISTSNPSMTRYFFNLLDNRSSYGKDFFPDAFIGPEFDAERQLELDYLHGERRGLRSDEVDAGFQWNVIGQLSIAAEWGWNSQEQLGALDGNAGSTEGDDGGGNVRGFENVDVAIYHPVYQFVSPDGFFDYTAAARLDFGIPTHTPASGTDLQLTPYLGQLLRIGDHLSLEGWTGPQITIAPDQTNQFIYGVSCGYAIFHEALPIPFTEKLTPIAELDGQTPLKTDGQDALFGVVGSDISFQSVGAVQPHLEIGYEFPLDQGARNQMQWGILAQFFLEF